MIDDFFQDRALFYENPPRPIPLIPGEAFFVSARRRIEVLTQMLTARVERVVACRVRIEALRSELRAACRAGTQTTCRLGSP